MRTLHYLIGGFVIGFVAVALALPAHSSPRANCSPILTHVEGAKHRAQRGWDAVQVRTRPKAQARARENARCVPEGKPERFVRKQIHRARDAYKAAVETANAYGDIDPPGEAYLFAVAQCESGGDYSINTGNGFYGGLQFTLQSWQAIGGAGLPSDASVDEQNYRGALLNRLSGPGNWPNCP